MKLFSLPLLGCMSFGFLIADVRLDCKDVGVASLFDLLWFSAAVEVSGQNAQAMIDEALADAGIDDGSGQSAPGPAGPPRRDW